MKTNNIILNRDDFRESVFKRDGFKCIICQDIYSSENLDAHHIIDRKCFKNEEDGGYYTNNGVTLCSECHQKAEDGIYTCDELREKASIIDIVLPKEFDKSLSYDKWGNVLKEEIIKYPRTAHIFSSGISKDDIKETISIEELRDKHLIIEAKIDGGNTAISFNNDCELMLQCRGHYLLGSGDWPEFNTFKIWANTWKDQLFDILSNRYIMYGEYMYAFHTVYYDLLPHYFMEFDIWDKEEKIFLSTERRKEITDKCDVKIEAVEVLGQGKFNNLDEIKNFVGVSNFISENAILLLEQECIEKKLPDIEKEILLSLNKDRLMEGLYLKWEEDGIVKGRYKYVRPEFVQAIISYDKHWTKRPTIPNRLKEGCDMFKIKE